MSTMKKNVDDTRTITIIPSFHASFSFLFLAQLFSLRIIPLLLAHIPQPWWPLNNDNATPSLSPSPTFYLPHSLALLSAKLWGLAKMSSPSRSSRLTFALMHIGLLGSQFWYIKKLQIDSKHAFIRGLNCKIFS